jgi:hypothetical protein
VTVVATPYVEVLGVGGFGGFITGGCRGAMVNWR